MNTILFVAILFSLAVIFFYLKRVADDVKKIISYMNDEEEEDCVCNPILKSATKTRKMATNHIVIDFTPCTPAPSGGYIVKYRPVGDVGAYRDAPGNPYSTSPIFFDDTLDGADQQYEGYVQSDCGDGNLGQQVPFETEAPVIEEQQAILNPLADNDITDLRVNGVTVELDLPATYPVVTGTGPVTGTYTPSLLSAVEVDLVGSPGTSYVRLIDSASVNHDLIWIGAGTYNFGGVNITTGFTISTHAGTP